MNILTVHTNHIALHTGFNFLESKIRTGSSAIHNNILMFAENVCCEDTRGWIAPEKWRTAGVRRGGGVWKLGRGALGEGAGGGRRSSAEAEAGCGGGDGGGRLWRGEEEEGREPRVRRAPRGFRQGRAAPVAAAARRG